MQFFGLTGLQLVSFLGASVLVVAVLYRLKLRRRTVRVSFAPLWRNVVRDRPATSLFERLRRLLSFLLQVAFVFLVLLAIARPRLSTDAERERRFVIVIDASASMQALMDLTSIPSRSRFEEAKDLARKLLRRLGETDRAMIVCAGLTPQPLTVFQTDRKPLFDAIRLLHPYDCRSNLADAVRFARSLVPDAPERVFVFTDRPRDATRSNVQWRQIGKPLDNLAITRFAARSSYASPGEYELLFEVRNFGRTDADVRLRIEDGSTLLENRPLRLAPGAKVSDVIRGIARKDMQLSAKLTTEDGKERRDGLALDNRAFAVVRAPRVITVTVVGEENFFLTNVLKSDPLIQWKRVTLADFSEDDAANIVVFDGCAPPTGAPRAIYISPGGEHSPVGASGEIKDVFVDKLAGEHPVMRFVGRLGDLNVAKSHVLVPETDDVVLASCAGSPVMLAREKDDRRLVVLGFDLRDSDLVLRVAFPKIFRNALSWLVSGEATPPRTHLTAGEALEIDTPGEHRRFVPRQVGFREVDDRPVAVNLSDETVSNLHAVPPPDESQATALSLAGTSIGWELWPYLVACALALTLFEWISYHRRWTV